MRLLRAGRIREEVADGCSKSSSARNVKDKYSPKAPRPAVVPKCCKLGVAVGTHLFYISDLANKKSLPILNMVDLGTNYQIWWAAKNPECFGMRFGTPAVAPLGCLSFSL